MSSLFARLHAQDLHIEIRELLATTLGVMRNVLLPVTTTQAKELRQRYPADHGNPSISADKRAAKAGVETLDRGFKHILEAIEPPSNPPLEPIFIVEESTDRYFVAEKVRTQHPRMPHPQTNVASTILSNAVCVIMDPVDGSLPFALGNDLGIGIPSLYACGLSLFIGGQNRYSGIWIPQPSPTDGTFIVIGLEGPDSNPSETIAAAMWRLGSAPVDLVQLFKHLERPTRLAKSFLTTHLSRSDHQARLLTLDLLAHEKLSKMNIFCLNSGLIGLLAVVFNGAVAVIPSTHIWDLAPIIPLFVAAHCSFSTTDGKPIDLTHYSADHRLSIVAASSQAVHQEMIELLQGIPFGR